MASEPTANMSTSPQRIPLGTSRQRLRYEHRIRLWLVAFALPTVVVSSLLIYLQSHSIAATVMVGLCVAVLLAGGSIYFFGQLIRPLQTLTNVVAALREDDFSFRARGARRGDSLGDLALEINSLANTLQSQRSTAQDALTLLERVITSMQSPVLAFDSGGYLRLVNPAAEAAFHLQHGRSLGRSAGELDLEALLTANDEGLYARSKPRLDTEADHVRWSVRRNTFRLHGIPHTLFVLSDVAAALREEERLAWQRLIRVLSHEINNSLTPIKSIAGSLRLRVAGNADQVAASSDDMRRGLTVIEDRAASLNRFLQAYQQLSRLPSPRIERIHLLDFLEKMTHLETRLSIELVPGPETYLRADPDQLQQLLINLIRNAADAALDPASANSPQVRLSWTTHATTLIVQVQDNGLGLINPENLFVPFYTTKPEGSGIGLVLAQQIASAHKGTVTLANNEHFGGCTAELRLPL
ncbi:HAMP domain-containing protein [Bryocella elongata]|uniref:histidine kinase n=1 Tax=Bryocella elongata TaxID=863522 RepID=A0A1H5Z2E9_9BACT|nr:ATP-binding protein [Bryocella elongata]SEG30789.1 HAMP domain-containing protein [Bryocella elongata]